MLAQASLLVYAAIVVAMTRDELDLLEARWRVREITESDLHAVADDLLASGEEGNALVYLFSLDRDQLRWAGADAFESLLRAWGGGTVDQEKAVGIVLRELAAGIVAGRITPLEATSRANAMDVRTAHTYSVLARWRDLQEERIHPWTERWRQRAERLVY